MPGGAGAGAGRHRETDNHNNNNSGHHGNVRGNGDGKNGGNNAGYQPYQGGNPMPQNLVYQSHYQECQPAQGSGGPRSG